MIELEKQAGIKCETNGITFNSRDDFAKCKGETMLHKRRSLQIKLFTYLDRPSGWKCLLYHIIVFALVLTTLTVSALETVQRVPWTSMLLYYLEIILVIIFASEYTLRIWAAGSHSCYQKVTGRLKYMIRPINIIDLVIVVASILSLSLGASESMFTATTVKSFRIIQIMRIIRVDRRGSTWSLVSSVIYKHRQELITSLYIGFLLLLVMSYMVFIAENYSKPSEEFRSLADALYFGMMTVTTVGYGDITPETWIGKTIVACCSVVTIAFFALPAGILATGFALKVQQKQREKQYNRQIPAAAILIQTMWRYKCINCFAGSNATWSRHAAMIADHRKKTVIDRMSKTTQDNKKSKPSVTSFQRKNTESNHYTINGNFSDYENYELTSSQRIQLKIIYILQYRAAIRKFQQLRNPYDVQDVIEQYSQGHFHLMMRIKELHRKLDQSVGKVNEYGVDKAKPTILDSLDKLNSKMNKLETVVINLQTITLSLAKLLDKNSVVKIEAKSLSLDSSNGDRNSTDDDDSNHEIKTGYSSDSESSEQRSIAKALYNNRFYLGHESVVSN